MKSFARWTTPTLLQMEATECGAAALGIILGYYGRHVPLTELRQQCGVSRDGSKASNIIQAARGYGCEATGFSKSLEAMQSNAQPCIVFWRFNHFVVFERSDSKYVYLNDPAIGHRRVGWDEFDEGFTGVVLTIEPGRDFQPGGKAPSVGRGLYNRLQRNISALVFIAMVGLLSVLPGLALPVYARVYIDSIVIDGRNDWFRPLMIVMSGTVILKLVLMGIQQHYIRRLRLSLAARLNSQFFWHLLHLPVSFYTQRFAGEVVGRMALNDRLASVVAGRLAAIVIDLFSMVLYGAILLMLNAPITILATALALINLAYLRWLAAVRVEANMRASQEAGKASSFSFAGIQSIETMKASGMEDDFFGKWMGYYAKASNASQELQAANLLSGAIPSIVDALVTVLILVVGGYGVISGEMTIGTLVAIQGLMTSYLSPVARITALGSTMQELRGDLLRLDDILTNAPLSELRPATHVDKTLPETPNAAMPLRLNGEVELRSVTFGYSPLDAPLIRDFSLRVRPGERIALVGGSGSGKSTIAKLICGLHQPWTGKILFDGKPANDWPSAVLRKSTAMVEQDILLFEGSVRDNLTLWDKLISDRELDRACFDAQIHDVVASLPRTYLAPLQEGGTNLSGGQRQRMELARALVGDPAILVLDEATSALDPETESVIDGNLRRRGCTCILVAHRLSTIRDCDEIIVLDNGSVVERGKHEELWQQDGYYARLLKQHESIERLDDLAMELKIRS